VTGGRKGGQVGNVHGNTSVIETRIQ